MPESEMQESILGQGENKRDEEREIHWKRWGGALKEFIMSEELIQRGLIEHGRPFGPYELYIIGQTTLNELARYQIIKSRDYGEFGNYKPDVILVDRRNPNDIRTILVIEHKSRSEFNTEKSKEEAIIQCKEQYCKPLESHIGIATDGETYIWFNPKIENNNLEYIYQKKMGIRLKLLLNIIQSNKYNNH